MVLSDQTIDGPAIRDKVLGTDHLAPTSMSLIEYHNEQQEIKLAPGTMKNYYTTQRYIKKFLREKYYRNDIIHEKLIMKAKEQLSTTNQSISEIAYGLGFEHPQSFSKLFKTKTKVSPLDFRQSFN